MLLRYELGSGQHPLEGKDIPLIRALNTAVCMGKSGNIKLQKHSMAELRRNTCTLKMQGFENGYALYCRTVRVNNCYEISESKASMSM
jgi:hypothetical protein